MLLLCGFLISNMFALRFRIALFRGIELADIFAILESFLLLSSEELFPFLTPNYLLNIISCDLMFLSRLLFRYRLLISHCVTLIAFQDFPLGLGPSGLRWARPSGEKVFYFKIVQAHILTFSFFLFSLKFPFGLVSNLLKNVLEFASLEKCFVFPFGIHYKQILTLIYDNN